MTISHADQRETTDTTTIDRSADLASRLGPMVIRHWKDVRSTRGKFDHACVELRTFINRLPRADHREPMLKSLDTLAERLGELEADVVHMARVVGCDDRLREQLRAMAG